MFEIGIFLVGFIVGGLAMWGILFLMNEPPSEDIRFIPRAFAKSSPKNSRVVIQTDEKAADLEEKQMKTIGWDHISKV